MEKDYSGYPGPAFLHLIVPSRGFVFDGGSLWYSEHIPLEASHVQLTAHFCDSQAAFRWMGQHLQTSIQREICS